MRQYVFSSLLLLLNSGLFADASTLIRHAKNFEISDHGTHRVVSVNDVFRGATKAYRYALVPRSAMLPELPDDLKVIRTPVQRVVAMETVQIGYLEALGQLNTVVGASTIDYIINPEIRKRISSGQIQSIQTGQALEVEKLLLLQPDVILTSISGDAAFDMPPKLERTGLPVALAAGYMEATPLARAEWIKFIAAFFEADALASQIFNSIETRYNELKSLTESVKDKPTILCGAPYSGIWHVPGGQSFIARMIGDAGGDYLWSDDPSQGGIPLDTERVFLKAANADFWLNPSFYRSMNALLSADERFGKFEAAKNGRVFNNTRQIGPSGGNAIWERGIVHPDDVLADLISIFHPDLLPKHHLIFHEQLN